MKKFLLSFFLIIAFTFYSLRLSNQQNSITATSKSSKTSVTSDVSQPITKPAVASGALVKTTIKTIAGGKTPSKTGLTSTSGSAPTVKVISASQSIATNVTTQQTNQPVYNSAPSQTVSIPVQTITPATTNAGKYKNGTYTGSVADAYYGNIQVQVTISKGQIADVAFLQYPNDRSTSREINSQAMPILKSEAIQSQTAKVDIVSGATDTSQAFQQSLGFALTQAANV